MTDIFTDQRMKGMYLIDMHSLYSCRGVGCIFTEMISGGATFPGVKDAFDQLDRIWQVSFIVARCTVMFNSAVQGSVIGKVQRLTIVFVHLFSSSGPFYSIKIEKF